MWEAIAIAVTALGGLAWKWYRDRKQSHAAEVARWARMGVQVLAYVGDSDILPGRADAAVDKVVEMLRGALGAPDPDGADAELVRKTARREAEAVAKLQNNVIAQRMIPFQLSSIAREAEEVGELFDQYERVSARLP